MDRHTETLLTELNAFVDAVLNDAPTSVSGHDGQMTVVVALAARKSYNEKRPVWVGRSGLMPETPVVT